MGMINTRSAISGHRKGIIAIALVLAFSFFQPTVTTTLQSSRLVRDATLMTPFHAAFVDAQHVTETGMVIAGGMTKRRCEFRSLTGYIVFQSGQRIRVPIDTSPEDIPGQTGNRPTSNVMERWGPWIIKFALDDIIVPIGWEVWAHHQCPNERTEQTNLFARGKWTTTEKPK